MSFRVALSSTIVIATSTLIASCRDRLELARPNSSDPQTNLFWDIGYNEVRSTVSIHIHFAEALPSRYGGGDADWEWDSWKAE